MRSPDCTDPTRHHHHHCCVHQLTAAELCRICAVSRMWKRYASDNALWRTLFVQRWGAPCDESIVFLRRRPWKFVYHVRHHIEATYTTRNLSVPPPPPQPSLPPPAPALVSASASAAAAHAGAPPLLAAAAAAPAPASAAAAPDAAETAVTRKRIARVHYLEWLINQGQFDAQREEALLHAFLYDECVKVRH